MNDKQIIVFFTSILFLNIFIKLLKKVIKQPRPIKTNTYGMPSSKSTITTFIFIYLISIHNYSIQTITILAILVIITILMKYLYKEHSLLQLFIGSLIGSIFAKIIVFLT